MKLIDLPYFPRISSFTLDTYLVDNDATADIADFNDFCTSWNTDNEPLFLVPSLENAGIKHNEFESAKTFAKVHVAKDWIGTPLSTAEKLSIDVNLRIWTEVIEFFKAKPEIIEEL